MCACVAAQLLVLVDVAVLVASVVVNVLVTVAAAAAACCFSARCMVCHFASDAPVAGDWVVPSIPGVQRADCSL